MLTLHFMLPFKTPVKAKCCGIEIFDPEFFVDFGFDEKDPVTLVGAPRAMQAVRTASRDDSNFPRADVSQA